jgi:hypothetical protein
MIDEMQQTVLEKAAARSGIASAADTINRMDTGVGEPTTSTWGARNDTNNLIDSQSQAQLVGESASMVGMGNIIRSGINTANASTPAPASLSSTNARAKAIQQRHEAAAARYHSMPYILAPSVLAYYFRSNSYLS